MGALIRAIFKKDPIMVFGIYISLESGKKDWQSLNKFNNLIKRLEQKHKIKVVIPSEVILGYEQNTPIGDIIKSTSFLELEANRIALLRANGVRCEIATFLLDLIIEQTFKVANERYASTFHRNKFLADSISSLEQLIKK